MSPGHGTAFPHLVGAWAPILATVIWTDVAFPGQTEHTWISAPEGITLALCPGKGEFMS